MPAPDYEVPASDYEVPASDYEVPVSDSEVPTCNLEMLVSGSELRASDSNASASDSEVYRSEHEITYKEMYSLSLDTGPIKYIIFMISTVSGSLQGRRNVLFSGGGLLKFLAIYNVSAGVVINDII